MDRRSFIKFLLTTPLGRLIAGVATAAVAAVYIYKDLVKIDVAPRRLEEGKRLYLPYPRLRGTSL